MLAVVLIIVAIAAVVIFVLYYKPELESPELAFSLLTSSGKAGESATLTLSATNNGNYTHKVTVHLVSDAFDETSSDPTNVPANQSVNINLNVNINEVDNGEYGITIGYQYDGMNGMVSANSETFYVLPSVQIVEEHWPGIGILEKSHIKRNDQTTFYFKVKNDISSNCRDLTAKLTLPSGVSGLTVAQSTCALDALGPQGKSGEYQFDFTSQNTPPGTYEFTVQIFSGQYEAYNKQFTIWVEQ
jgi:hypothetical protein